MTMSGECMFCHMVEREVEDQTRIVIKSERFVAMEVFASATPFATHIFPLRHMASFGDISEMEVDRSGASSADFAGEDLCGAGKSGLEFYGPQRAGGVCGSAALSLVRQRDSAADADSGFELGSGMFINTVLPEAAAEFLRKVTVEKVAGAGAGM